MTTLKMPRGYQLHFLDRYLYFFPVIFIYLFIFLFHYQIKVEEFFTINPLSPSSTDWCCSNTATVARKRLPGLQLHPAVSSPSKTSNILTTVKCLINCKIPRERERWKKSFSLIKTHVYRRKYRKQVRVRERYKNHRNMRSVNKYNYIITIFGCDGMA